MNNVKYILLIILIGLAGFIGFVVGNNSYRKPVNQVVKMAVTNQPLITILPTHKIQITPSTTQDQWIEYNSQEKGFSIKYPKDVPINNHEDGLVSFEVWGPSQKPDTEFYDGLSISLQPRQLDGKTLDQIVSDNIKGSEEVWGIAIDPAKPVTIGGVSGLTYKAGDHQYYYLPLKNDWYLELFNLTNDPTNQGYEKQASDMINTLTISL